VYDSSHPLSLALPAPYQELTSVGFSGGTHACPGARIIYHAKVFRRERGGLERVPPPGNPSIRTLTCFLEGGFCPGAEQGRPCKIRTISHGREKAEKGLCGGGSSAPPLSVSERRSEDSLTNRACTCLPLAPLRGLEAKRDAAHKRKRPRLLKAWPQKLVEMPGIEPGSEAFDLRRLQA
jgi:hypothetical protein